MWNPVVTGALTLLFIEVPWLNVPVIRQLTTWIVEAVSDFLFTHLQLVIDVTAIELMNVDHMNAFNAASLKLKVVALDSGVESPEYAQALTDAKAALARFTQFNV